MANNERKELYSFQANDVSLLLERLNSKHACRILYQLPTGGGKTVVFSELAKQYAASDNKKILVLTHRIELCKQTAATIKKSGLKTKVLCSNVKSIRQKSGYSCMVAMVETLKNRLKEKLVEVGDIGLVIVDEAHHNSFRKLLSFFADAHIIGVTATPLSADINLPLHKSYDELITGMDIKSLIGKGVLAKPQTYSYDVELNTLQTGLGGDFTVKTSDELYGTPAMLQLLVETYKKHALGKRTLIFNNGVLTSRLVCDALNTAGIEARHLDHKTCAVERAETLKWFKKKKGAVLTSVSLLTTGFDEPSIKAVIINRATTSITLYHQMVGRGARSLPGKKRFTIIDLGNNTDRMGHWEDAVDWRDIFERPEKYTCAHTHNDELHPISSQLRLSFPNSLEIAFDIPDAYNNALRDGQKPKRVIRDSLRQHAYMCIENAATVSQAIELALKLDKEIDWRVKQYCKCLGNATTSYKKWLQVDYKTKLSAIVTKLMQRKSNLAEAV